MTVMEEITRRAALTTLAAVPVVARVDVDSISDVEADLLSLAARNYTKADTVGYDPSTGRSRWNIDPAKYPLLAEEDEAYKILRRSNAWARRTEGCLRDAARRAEGQPLLHCDRAGTARARGASGQGGGVERERGREPLVVKMMLSHNAFAGWEFLCPGPELPVAGGGHKHQPHWLAMDGRRKFYPSQAARGIVWP